MYEWGVSFDWITPIMQVMHMARGCKGLVVTVEELRKLESRGIYGWAAMLDPMTGEYLVQISGKKYKEACEILGLRHG